MRPRVAVVGGGISGLSAAHALAKHSSSVDVLLLEGANRLGGVLESTRQDGLLFESAADSFLTTPPVAVELCRQLGLEDSLVGTNPRWRRAFVVHKGRLQPIPDGFLMLAPSRIRPMLASPILGLGAKLRLGLEYLVPRNELNSDESLASFVRRRFGREMYDRLVQPLVGGIYAADAERLSLTATMPRFREMERKYGSLIRAALRQRRSHTGDNSSGAAYGRFATLREGMMCLIHALAKRLPAQSVRLDSPVDSVLPTAAGNGWLLSIGGSCPHRLQVDGVILATPAYRSAGLLVGLDSVLANELSQIQYTSCAVVSLAYRRDQIKHALNGFGFVVPLVEQRAILSCSFSSVKYDGRAPAGNVLMRVFIGGACQSGLLRRTDEEIFELAEREIADLLRIQGEPIKRQLTHQRRAMPQYNVGHRDRVAAISERLKRFSALALAGNAYGGVGIPACIQSGLDAAESILAGISNSARPAVRNVR